MDEYLAEAVAQGRRGINKSVMMPAWRNTLEPYHVEYMAGYIKTLSEVTGEADGEMRRYY